MQRSSPKVIGNPKTKITQNSKSWIPRHHGRRSQRANEGLGSLKNITPRWLNRPVDGYSIVQLLSENNLGEEVEKGRYKKQGEN